LTSGTAGALQSGGADAPTNPSQGAGGGGGGGYYGGGGGTSSTSSGDGGYGGGGGSSLVPVGGSTTPGYQTGNGYVNLTWTPDSSGMIAIL
jgi:hypothetical protein